MLRFLVVVLVALAVAASALVAMLALSGRGGVLDRRPLVAEVTISPFVLPQGYGLDPVAITEELVERLKARVDSDIALQMLLGTEGATALREQAIPRLVNAGVLRRLIEEMDGLGTVIELAEVRAGAEVTVTNRGAAPLDDVALVLPGATRAEGAAGPPLDLRAASEGDLAALALGALAPGESRRVRLWLALPPEDIAARRQEVRLGAAGGVDGAVRLYASQTGWNGAALQVLPWARWLVAGVLAAVAAGGVVLAGLLVVTGLRAPRRA